MTYTEWKAQRDAKAALRAAVKGEVISLEAVRAQLAESDRVLAASRAQRERALQLVGYSEDQTASPGMTICERARAAGMPVKDLGDYKRAKLLFGGGDAA